MLEINNFRCFQRWKRGKWKVLANHSNWDTSHMQFSIYMTIGIVIELGQHRNLGGDQRKLAVMSSSYKQKQKPVQLLTELKPIFYDWLRNMHSWTKHTVMFSSFHQWGLAGSVCLISLTSSVSDACMGPLSESKPSYAVILQGTLFKPPYVFAHAH